MFGFILIVCSVVAGGGEELTTGRREEEEELVEEALQLFTDECLVSLFHGDDGFLHNS